MADVLELLAVALIPTTLEQLLFMLVSFSGSLTFLKGLDKELQETPQFIALAEDKSLYGILKHRLAKTLLDTLHHWWAGLGLIVYASTPWMSWVGAGLLVADLPDMMRRLGELKQIVGEQLSR